MPQITPQGKRQGIQRCDPPLDQQAHTALKNAMQFETLSTLLAFVGFLLAIGWMVAAPLMLRRWRCEANPVALVVGRRLGVVYLSVSMIFFWTRSTTSMEVQHVLSMLAAVANLLLAVVGTTEFLRQRVGPGIFVSVLAEILFVLGYGLLLAN